MVTREPVSTPTFERVNVIVRRTGISRSHLYELLASGRIPSAKVGRIVLVPAGATERYIDDVNERACQRGLPIDLTGGAAA